MSLIIKNLDTVDIALDDLGLTLPASSTLDLTQEEAGDVARSANGGDLDTQITNLKIAVLDPIDDVTQLNVADSKEALRRANDAQFRIQAGDLHQLDDVSITQGGSPLTSMPIIGDVLQFNGSLWNNTPASSLDTEVDRIQTIYVGKHGSDSNDGLAPNTAKLTFGAAITAATAGSPQVQYSIVCEDGGTYTENITVPGMVRVDAPNSIIMGTITVNDDAELFVKEVNPTTNTNGIEKLTGSGTARVTAEIIRATGTGDAISTTAANVGPLIVEASQVFAEDGAAVIDNSTGPQGHIHIDIEDVYVTGTGNGLDRNSSSGLIVGKVSHLLEIGGGVGNATGIDVDTGTVDVIVGFLDTTVGYDVSGGGTLRMLVNQISGARNQNSGAATVDVIEADVLRWQTITSADSPFTPRRIGFISIDTFVAPVLMNLPYPPSDGDNVSFQDARNTFGTNNLTVAGDGAAIDNGVGSPSTVVFDVDGTSGVFIYQASTSMWTFSRIQEEVAFSPANLIYVTKNGNDITGDGSFSNPFLTIKRGLTEAKSRVSGSPTSAAVPTTVKVLDGVFDEINPLELDGVNSNLIQIQGDQDFAVIVRPTVATQPLFTMQCDQPERGPVLNRFTIDGSTLPAFRSNNQAGIVMSGPGRMVADRVNINECGIGIDSGNAAASPDDTATQEAVYDFATISNCNTAIDVKGNGIQAIQVAFFRGNDVGLRGAENVRIEIGNFSIQGANVTGSPPQFGTGIEMNDQAVLIGTSGTITNLELGLEANDTTETTLATTVFGNNTTEFNQVDATAVVGIQGFLSRSKQIITDGAEVSLNYVDTDTADFIVGNAENLGQGSPQDTAGLQFRVRDADGRLFIGDQAENYNAPTNTVGGSRTVNLIDTNGNFRIWRWQATPGLHPAFEWVKGENTFIADGEGDAPITAITAGTDTITIDLSGADYNDPLDPVPGSDRTTLDQRVFFPGAELRVNGTASNNGDYVVSSSTYNSGPETIDVVVTTDITVSEGAGGSAVFGGGAGRPDGVSTYIDDPSAAIAAGVGDVHWDMLLRETDSFAVRRRTGGAGKEHFRFFRDRTEIQHGPAYDGSDNNLVAIFRGVGGDSYLELDNTTGGPQISVQNDAIGSPGDADINLIPGGIGTVLVPSGYEANVVDDSLITKEYIDTQVSTGILQKYVFDARLLLSPTNADWVVNALAPASQDSNNNALTVRLFDDTTEEGVGFLVEIPSNATSMTIRFRSRAETAPGVTETVIPNLYRRSIPDDGAVGAWSAALALTALSFPTNENFQYDEQTITLATLGLNAGEVAQFELTRDGTGTLTGDWTLLRLELEFS